LWWGAGEIEGRVCYEKTLKTRTTPATNGQWCSDQIILEDENAGYSVTGWGEIEGRVWYEKTLKRRTITARNGQWCSDQITLEDENESTNVNWYILKPILG